MPFCVYVPEAVRVGFVKRHCEITSMLTMAPRVGRVS